MTRLGVKVNFKFEFHTPEIHPEGKLQNTLTKDYVEIRL